MRKQDGLMGSWAMGLALVCALFGCTPRTDIGVSSDRGSGGEGLPSSEAGSGGNLPDGEGGNSEGGSSGSQAGSSGAVGGNGGSTTSGGASGTSSTGGDSGSTATGGSAGSDQGGSAGSGDPWSSSPVMCGRLGDLSAVTGFAVDVGHETGILALSKTATRLLSYDNLAAWVLWDTDTKTLVERGRSEPDASSRECDACDKPFPSSPIISGSHMAALAWVKSGPVKIGDVFDLELRSAVDGALIATLTMPDLDGATRFGFASDDSYLWAATKAGLRAWSTNGDLLAEASGDYRNAGVSAVPGELRIGSPSRSTIERISTATGTASFSAAFQGTFASWFLDGARFLTTISSTVRVYSTATLTQTHIFALSSIDHLTGQGDYVWTLGSGLYPYQLDIYALSDPSTPAGTYALGTPKVFAGGNLITAMGNAGGIDRYELGPTITHSWVATPGNVVSNVVTADAAGNWAVGGLSGEVFESSDPTHSLSCGEISSIARAADGTTAVGTAIGGILLFKLTPDSRQYLGTIPFPRSHLELSRDGRVLAASDGRAFSVFSLPDQTEIKTWPYSFSGMSSQGNRFGHKIGILDQGFLEVRDLDDHVSLSVVHAGDFESHMRHPLQLSADGTLVAIGSGNAANIYENGVLVNALPGKPLAWFDDDRLLVELDGAWRTYDTSGQLEPAPYLDAPYDGTAYIVSASEIYSPGSGAIYSLTSGEKVWSCEPSPREAAAAAGYAVFTNAITPNKVFFDTY